MTAAGTPRLLLGLLAAAALVAGSFLFGRPAPEPPPSPEPPVSAPAPAPEPAAAPRSPAAPRIPPPASTPGPAQRGGESTEASDPDDDAGPRVFSVEGELDADGEGVTFRADVDCEVDCDVVLHVRLPGEPWRQAPLEEAEDGTWALRVPVDPDASGAVDWWLQVREDETGRRAASGGPGEPRAIALP